MGKVYSNIILALLFRAISREMSTHSNSGSTGGNSGGLLEDDVGVPVWLYRDAVGRWPGL